ncbi:MAG: dihydroneopterin aldolase [Proteobacteria bacterium]|jgi:dihydroneopterin aldolase|nr:dihydroneopterin aldolase [Pseudomonadota bacterium]
MDTIFIHDLRVETRVGVYAWEQDLAQTLRIDAELGLASSRAFETGALADAVDYAAVVAHVKAFASDHPHRLLERFAEALAQSILASFRAASVSLRVAKLGALPGVREIGVSIERTAPKTAR